MSVSEPYADHELWSCQCRGRSLYLNEGDNGIPLKSVISKILAKKSEISKI